MLGRECLAWIRVRDGNIVFPRTRKMKKTKENEDYILAIPCKNVTGPRSPAIYLKPVPEDGARANERRRPLLDHFGLTYEYYFAA